MREDEKKGAPAETGNTALTIGNNSPQWMSLIKPLSSYNYLLQLANQSSGILWTDLPLPANIPDEADGVFLFMVMTWNSGKGYGYFVVRGTGAQSPSWNGVYGNANLPANTLCPYIAVNYHKIQYYLALIGAGNVTLALTIMGYTVPLVAHNHPITPDPHKHGI